jgi:hypothetical protein
MLLGRERVATPGGVADEQVRWQVIRRRGAGGLRPRRGAGVCGGRAPVLRHAASVEGCPHVGTAGRFAHGASSLVVVQRNQTYFFGYLPGAPEQAVR